MLGDVDDLAQIQVNLEKAATAVDLLVTVKNKAVDAYNEIICMTAWTILIYTSREGYIYR